VIIDYLSDLLEEPFKKSSKQKPTSDSLQEKFDSVSKNEGNYSETNIKMEKLCFKVETVSGRTCYGQVQSSF
jgi:hypothetical protein